MKLEVRFNFSREMLLNCLAALLILGGSFTLWVSMRQPMANKPAANSSPVPAQIREQMSYKAIYPADTSVIDGSSFAYQAQQQMLSFNAEVANNQVNFSEEPAPSSIGTGNQVYFQAIGLHPFAQFESELGPVALARFYDSKSLNPAGESAVLASHGTLVIAHSTTQLGNDTWKNLFNSLKLGQ
jgi:hypothetical protein